MAVGTLKILETQTEATDKLLRLLKFAPKQVNRAHMLVVNIEMAWIEYFYFAEELRPFGQVATERVRLRDQIQLESSGYSITVGNYSSTPSVIDISGVTSQLRQ